MARRYVRPNVVTRFELHPRSGERSYDSLFFANCDVTRRVIFVCVEY